MYIYIYFSNSIFLLKSLIGIFASYETLTLGLKLISYKNAKKRNGSKNFEKAKQIQVPIVSFDQRSEIIFNLPFMLDRATGGVELQH